MAPDTLSAAVDGASYIARARALVPTVAALADRIERERRLPPELLDAMHAAGLFRMVLPRSMQGGEVEPEVLFHVMEALAGADASTAWCLGQASGCASVAAYLDPAVAWKIFGSDPRAVLAWGPGPQVRAVACEGGYRVSGTWSFASGCRHATWLGADCPLFLADGTAQRDAAGRSIFRTFLVPAAAVRWDDIWDVIGLRGTASDAFTLTDHFVASDHSVTRDYTLRAECREPGPLYRIGMMLIYETAFAGVACGIARAALDYFTDFARSKIPRGKPSPIRDNAVVQTGLAEAEVRLLSARGWLLSTIAAIWDDVCRPDGALTLEHRMRMRLACTWAIHQARHAVDFAWDAAGASAIFAANPLERRFRDMHTLTQQLQGRLSHLESVGAHMMGASADTTFV